MKVINSELFAVAHPSAWEVEQKHIGKHKNRIVVVRNFFKYPDEVFLFVSYVLGTAMGLWFANQKIKNAVENTIDHLIDQDFIQTKKNKDGELDLLKWYER